MNNITKEELSTWSTSKLVDTLYVYITKENARLQKQSDYHKQYNAKIAKEREEFRAWKSSK
jgi:hypothetical protein